MTVEQLGEQGVELPSFRGVEAGEELVLDGVGVPLELLEMSPAVGGEGDDVAAAVGGVGLTVGMVAALEALDRRPTGPRR